MVDDTCDEDEQELQPVASTPRHVGQIAAAAASSPARQNPYRNRCVAAHGHYQ